MLALTKDFLLAIFVISVPLVIFVTYKAITMKDCHPLEWIFGEITYDTAKPKEKVLSHTLVETTDRFTGITSVEYTSTGYNGILVEALGHSKTYCGRVILRRLRTNPEYGKCWSGRVAWLVDGKPTDIVQPTCSSTVMDQDIKILKETFVFQLDYENTEAFKNATTIEVRIDDEHESHTPREYKLAPEQVTGMRNALKIQFEPEKPRPIINTWELTFIKPGNKT